MTRINLVPVEELTDQHLLAEYRELPRCLNKPTRSPRDFPVYVLGKGHVKWAEAHQKFLLNRYGKIIDEMKRRGFSPKYSQNAAKFERIRRLPDIYDYSPTKEDIELSRSRIEEKLRLRPTWYRWTKPIQNENTDRN